MRQKTIEKIRRLCNPDHHRVECVCKDCQILTLLDQEDRAEEMAKDTQELVYLANVTASYMDMPPSHPLYNHTAVDVRNSLKRLFNKKEG